MKLEVGKWYWITPQGVNANAAARVKCLALTPKGLVGLEYDWFGAPARRPEQWPESFVISEVAPADIPDERPWYRRLFG